MAWHPPDVRLGFLVAGQSAPAAVLRPARWWRQPLPAWAQAAAAVVLFGAGVGLGVWRGSGGLAAVPPSAESAAPIGQDAPVSVADLQALEERLKAELLASRGSPQSVSTDVSRQSDDVLLQQVRSLIRESELRQRRELALRTAELVKDVDAQRRGDLARIERTFGQMEGTTGVQVEQQRQLLNYLMRVSQRPQ